MTKKVMAHKKSAKLQNIFFSGIQVGRLQWSVAKAIGRKCANIYVARSYIRHIEALHGNQFANLGMDGLSYVRYIVSCFTEIRQGSEDSLLLVASIKDSEKAHVAAIDLEYNERGDFWQVKTAQPRSRRAVNKKVRLWEEAKASTAPATVLI